MPEKINDTRAQTIFIYGNIIGDSLHETGALKTSMIMSRESEKMAEDLVTNLVAAPKMAVQNHQQRRNKVINIDI